MRKSTCIFLFITLLLYIATLILSIITLVKYGDLIAKKLLLAYIIIDSLSVIYILYRFCYIKTILGFTEFVKFLFLFVCNFWQNKTPVLDLLQQTGVNAGWLLFCLSQGVGQSILTLSLVS